MHPSFRTTALLTATLRYLDAHEHSGREARDASDNPVTCGVKGLGMLLKGSRLTDRDEEGVDEAVVEKVVEVMKKAGIATRRIRVFGVPLLGPLQHMFVPFLRQSRLSSTRSTRSDEQES